MASIDVFVVSATSLESIRRSAEVQSNDPRPMDFHFDRLDDRQKPLPTEMGRFFSMNDAEDFRARLHSSWFRPSITRISEPKSAQHIAHGGEVGK